MDVSRISVVDLEHYRAGGVRKCAAIAEEVDYACRSIGFLLVSGHQVDEALLASMRDVSAAFFDQPEPDKLAFHRTDTSRGYVPVEAENLGATAGHGPGAPADLKEAFAVSRVDVADDATALVDSGIRPVAWPDVPAGFRGTWTRYYHAMHGLATRIMALFAAALGVPPDFFAGKMSMSADFLRAINYPSQQLPPAPGQLRAGAHTDFGTLTILMTDDAPGGLQVRDGAGSWVDVPLVPGSFVINIGDMMAHWTNYRWRSTVHRVTNPASEVAAEARRLSVVFFHNPNLHAVVEPIPTCRVPGEPVAEPVTAGEWLRDKTRRQRGGRADTTSGS